MDESDYFVCPHCGEELPLKAKSCKFCGSDSETGWSPDADPFASEAPDSFDYEESVEREFGENSGKKSLNWVSITGFILLLLIVLYFLKAY